jgi:hypothetical protein
MESGFGDEGAGIRLREKTGVVAVTRLAVLVSCRGYHAVRKPRADAGPVAARQGRTRADGREPQEDGEDA